MLAVCFFERLAPHCISPAHSSHGHPSSAAGRGRPLGFVRRGVRAEVEGLTESTLAKTGPEQRPATRLHKGTVGGEFRRHVRAAEEAEGRAPTFEERQRNRKLARKHAAVSSEELLV